MDARRSKSRSQREGVFSVRRVYGLLAPRGHSILMFAALLCTLAVKFFHSWRCNSVREYPDWVLADISVLLGIEVLLALVCYRWPRKWVIRTATIAAAVVCTWSVMNAAWLIRTGTQILPTDLLPLVRDPINTLGMVLVNMLRMPKTSAILLIPGALAFVFFICVLVRPVRPNYDRRLFAAKVAVSVVVICVAAAAHAAAGTGGSGQVTSAGLRYNCQSRGIAMFVHPGFRHLGRSDFADPKRWIPTFDQLTLPLKPQHVNHNIVIVVLEGIQYNYTSLAAEERGLPAAADSTASARTDPTPFLGSLAKQGVNFTNARSAVTHTTKALFALLTGRVPSASKDIAEAVPVAKPYAGLVTILEGQMNFRTAFFQSATGTFEARPGLVHNLGFDKFWAREDSGDPNGFVGYLGCDEFSMLRPVTEWIVGQKGPFLLVVLCSVTHDPYEVPGWFGELAKERTDKYRQAVSYTDKFLAALDVELSRLNLADKTIFCVIGDHGEAFGEHGALGHDRIPFDEVLRIPFCLRAPFLVGPGVRITAPVSSIDLAPTLLALLGFDAESGGFDGANVLGALQSDRRLYFSGWMDQGPAGYVEGSRKLFHDPTDNTVSLYDIDADPYELSRISVDLKQGQKIGEEIIGWRKNTIFRVSQQRSGQERLFDTWLCKWVGRIATVRHRDSS